MAVGERDPVSVLWDGPARALLRRAIDAKGEWQGTRIADPSERQRAMIRALGINVNARDNPSAQGGRARGGHGINAKTRWARGFVRAVFYHNDRRHGGAGPVSGAGGGPVPARGGDGPGGVCGPAADGAGRVGGPAGGAKAAGGGTDLHRCGGAGDAVV